MGHYSSLTPRSVYGQGVLGAFVAAQAGKIIGEAETH
jgi:hypothetical protein